MQLLYYTERMNALTTSIDINGSCNILGKQFEISLNDQQIYLYKQQKNFSLHTEINPNKGWNTIYITHNEHDNDLTVIENNKIVDYSYVSLDNIKINDYEISFGMWQDSNSCAYNPQTKKVLHLYNLGEPFCVELKFYWPIEHWTFALASSNTHQGRMGWKHA